MHLTAQLLFYLTATVIIASVKWQSEGLFCWRPSISMCACVGNNFQTTDHKTM